MSEAATAEAKREALCDLIRDSAPLVIAYSGGVDSAFLLAVAVETIGGGCLGVIADSPSLPRQALADALQLAGQIGAAIVVAATDEMSDPNYTINPVNRCYFCKAELFTKLDKLARERGFHAIAYGENSRRCTPGSPGAGSGQGVSGTCATAGSWPNEKRNSRALSGDEPVDG